MSFKKFSLFFLLTGLFQVVFGSHITSPSFFGPNANLINFDQFASGTNLTFHNGVHFSSESSSHLDYPDYTDPMDVNNRFDAPFWVGPTISGGGAALSLPNYAAGADHNGSNESDMRFDFDFPQASVGMWIIDNDLTDVRMRAFDSTGNIVASIVILRVSEGGIGFHGIAVDTPIISYIILDGNGGVFLDSTFIDDLYYETVEVTTPSHISDPDYFSPDAELLTFDEFSHFAELSYHNGISFSAESYEHIGFPDYTDPADLNNRFDAPFLIIHTAGGGGVPISPPSYIAGPVHHGTNVSDMRIDFDSPLRAVGMWIIDNDYSDARMRAFSASGILLETVIIPEVGEGGIGFHGIYADSPGISYIIIDAKNGNALDSTFIDDLYYETLVSYIPPIADPNGPYTIYVGDPLTLDASSSLDEDGTIESYLWDLDDDGSFETDAGTNPIFTVEYEYLQSLGLLVNDTRSITLQVMDNDQKTDTAATTLSIIPKPALKVSVDIKPTSCPNPLNVKSSGVLPVAILGTSDFDVSTIDPTSIELNGVRPIRSSYEDVATPMQMISDCNCITDGPDGFIDLTLKFKTQEIVESIGEVNDKEVFTLELIGVLLGERPIEGFDCVVIKGRHKPFNKGDINRDGMVDMLDYIAISNNWLKSSKNN